MRGEAQMPLPHPSDTTVLGGTMDGNTTEETLGMLDRPYPHLAQEVIMWILPVPMVLLNIVVFVVAPRMKTIRPCTAYGMLSLAMADFCLGLTHLMRMSYNTHTGYRLQQGHPVCIVDGYCQALFASISIVTLAFMNVDRLLTVAFPLRYPRRLSKCRVISAHVSIWVLLICFMAPVITGAAGTSVKYYEHAFMCVPDWAGSLVYNLVALAITNVIPTFVIAVCFGGIFYFARTKSKELKRASGGSGVQVHHGGRRNAATSSEDSQRDMRIFKTLALMTFGFYLAWMPYFVTVAIPELIAGRSLNHVTDFITPWLGASNSFWNPLIYVPTMRPFYTAMVKLWDDCMDACCGGCSRTKEDSVDGRPLNNASTSSNSSGAASSNPASSSGMPGGTGNTGLTNSAMKETASNAV